MLKKANFPITDGTSKNSNDMGFCEPSYEVKMAVRFPADVWKVWKIRKIC